MDESTEEKVCIFDKGNNELNHDEIWDDTILIKNYNETMEKAYKVVAQRINSTSLTSDSEAISDIQLNYNACKENKKKKKNKNKHEWRPGDPCRAIYENDNNEYEATVCKLNKNKGMCTVKFVGYNNKQEANIFSLLKSYGEEERKKQKFEAQESFSQSEDGISSAVESEVPTDLDNVNNMARNNPNAFMSNMMSPPQSFSIRPPPHLPLLPPPPAMGLVHEGSTSATEALHTMLMSWYMTGYHTGYYQAIKERKRKH